MSSEDIELVIHRNGGIKELKQKTKDILLKYKVLYFLNQTGKRCIDIGAAIVGVIILLPILICVILLKIKNRETGSIFFAQKRIGKNGKLFNMYKFRTMKLNADEELEEILQKDPKARIEYEKTKKLKDDPRVTKTGRILRKTSLDEFPQFINVLKGDMSLVGPRPYLPREKDDMGYYYYYVTKCRPGITGLWQTSGRSDVSFDERLDLDIRYYQDATVFEDVNLVLKTVMKTIKGEGAM